MSKFPDREGRARRRRVAVRRRAAPAGLLLWTLLAAVGTSVPLPAALAGAAGKLSPPPVQAGAVATTPASVDCPDSDSLTCAGRQPIPAGQTRVASGDVIPPLNVPGREYAWPLVVPALFVLFAVVAFVVWRSGRERARVNRRLSLQEFSLDHLGECVVWIGVDAKLVDANAAFCELLGYQREELQQRSIPDIDLIVGWPEWRELYARLIRDGVSKFDTLFETRDGRSIEVTLHARLFEYEGNEYVCAIGRDVTAEKQGRRIEFAQSELLQLIAHRHIDLDTVLARVVEVTERLCVNLRASILLVKDGRLWHGAAPCLDPRYVSAIDGIEAGPGVGSCGTAVHRRAPVIVHDVLCDPLWAPFRGLAGEFGFRACWSYPVLDRNEEPVATLALYRDEPSRPNAFERRLMSVMVEILRVAIENRRLVDHFDQMFNNSPNGLLLATASGRVVRANACACEWFGYSGAEMVGMDLGRLVPINLRAIMDSGDGQVAGRDGTGGRHDLFAVTRHDERFPVEVSVTPLEESEGERLVFVTVIDLTECVRQRLALARSEARFRDLYNRTPIMLHSIDRDGRIIEVSDYWLEHLGYTREQVIDEPIANFLTEESRERLIKEIRPRFLEPGLVDRVPLQFVKSDGEIIDVEFSAHARYDDEGNFLRSLTVVHDVTDRNRAEGEYRRVFNNATEGIFRTTPDGRLIRANPALVRMHGMETEEQLVAASTDLPRQWYVNPEDRERLIERVYAEGKVDGFECEGYRVATGERVWRSINARVVRDHDGSVVYHEGSVIDITERKRQEAELQRRTAELARSNIELEGVLATRQALINSLPADVAMLDANGMIVDVNERWMDFLRERGRSVEDFGVGANYLDVCAAGMDPATDVADKVVDGLRQVLAGRREFFSLEYRFDAGASGLGGDRWFRLMTQRLDPAAGNQPSGAVVMYVDITEQKRQEEALQRKTDELVRSNRELDDFAYVASHDLKAPLNGLRQIADWIEQDIGGEVGAETLDHLRLMRCRVQRMMMLLEDLLEYSRVGRSGQEPEMIESAGLVRDLFMLVAPSSGFELSLSGQFPRFMTLRTPLEQVFRNLFDNAIKHHDRDEGCIRVSVGEDGGDYAFTVSDDGPGIPPVYHERAFDMFRTLQPRDRVEGSGMGLAMVKKIVETYGGDIAIVSGAGRGTSIRVRWPGEMRSRRLPAA